MAACNQREPYEEPQRFREEGLLSRLPGGAGSTAGAWAGRDGVKCGCADGVGVSG